MTASKLQVQQIAQKLKALECEKDILCECIVSYVDHISAKGRAWVDCEGQNGTRFSELNDILRNCISFLTKIQDGVYAGPGLEDSKELASDVHIQPLFTSAPSSLMTSAPSSFLSSLSSSEISGTQYPDHAIKTLQEQVKALEIKVAEIQKGVIVTEKGQDESGISKPGEPNFIPTDDLENIQVVGFTASVPTPTNLVTDKELTCFTDIISNIGFQYAAETGVFTAPYDGVYMASLTHWQDGDGRVRLSVIHELERPGSEAHRAVIGVTNTRTSNASSSCVSVVRMEEGDILRVKVCLVDGGAGISRLSSWSCCLIG